MYTRMFIEVLQKKVYCCISGALFSETYIIILFILKPRCIGLVDT